MKTKSKMFRTTIDGYYIHDARKIAKFAFDEFLIHVKYNDKNHCYDILLKDRITENKQQKELCKEKLVRFKQFFPKSFNVIILSEKQFDLLMN